MFISNICPADISANSISKAPLSMNHRANSLSSGNDCPVESAGGGRALSVASAGDYCWEYEASVSGPPGNPRPESDISVSGSAAFGALEINTWAERTLTIANSGTADLLIGSLNGLSAPFSIVFDACSSGTLAPGSFCTVSLRFSPTVAGYQRATLKVSSHDPNESDIVITASGAGTKFDSGINPDFDPLNGNGNVTRSHLTADTLLNGSDPGSRVDLSAYAVPGNAARPDHVFEGSLELFGESVGGSFSVVKDTFRLTDNKDSTRKHLPEFNFEFVQTGTHLLPVERGTMSDTHPEWEYILEAGRVWKENGDHGFSRAAIPFTLHEKNANCMHNGVLTFLFRDDGSISRVAYQISSETCLYFKADMWGLLDAVYSPAPVVNADKLRRQYQDEVNGRMPVKPISELAVDYPGTDPEQFGSAAETNPEHMTIYGFIIDGVHYAGGCETRYGTYPYCDNLVIPSYSTAKSVFAGLAMMRMELKHPGFMGNIVADQVPDCAANGNWNDVTYANVIDMASGNYGSGLYMSDEHSLHTGRLFQALDHASKIDYSCTQYSRKSAPGSKWVYHTSDTYILGTAMNAEIKDLEGADQDIFTDMLVEEIFKPIGTSPTSHVTRRTYDTVQQPFTGWGLSFLRDDVAKLSQFLNVDDGMVDGQMLLDPLEFDAALQRDPGDRGLSPSTDLKYNNGFWAREIKSSTACAMDTWVPFMSGFGGISVVLLPNDTTYYAFSDDNTFLWMDAALESHRIRSLCP